MARNIINMPTPEVKEVELRFIPNPLTDKGAAALNIRTVAKLEGKTYAESVREAWGIDALLPLVENAPLSENFADRNLIEVEMDSSGNVARLIDGNRRTCCFHILHELYPEGHEVTRRVQGPQGGVSKETFRKDYTTIKVKAYPPLTEAQFRELQRRDVRARRGLGKVEFYNLAFSALDDFSKISEAELLLTIGEEVQKAAFPNHKKGGAWRETLQNIRRVWQMPGFVRAQFMAKVMDTDKSDTKPTGGDVRALNALWKPVMDADKAGVLNNSLLSVEEVEEAMERATEAAAEKCRRFLTKWSEIMSNNGKKGGGKSSASKSAQDVDSAADVLKKAGAPMAGCLLKWQRNIDGCGSEEVFGVLRDYFVAADASLKAQDKDAYNAFYKRLNEAIG